MATWSRLGFPFALVPTLTVLVWSLTAGSPLKTMFCGIVSLVSQIIGILRLVNCVFVDTSVLLRCYDAFVPQILEYCSPVCQADVLETVSYNWQCFNQLLHQTQFYMQKCEYYFLSVNKMLMWNVGITIGLRSDFGCQFISTQCISRDQPSHMHRKRGYFVYTRY